MPNGVPCQPAHARFGFACAHHVVSTACFRRFRLAWRAQDSLVTHFGHFVHEDRQLPVMWHTALLTFVQRYKDNLTPEGEQTSLPRLASLVDSPPHHANGPAASRGRGMHISAPSPTTWIHDTAS